MKVVVTLAFDAQAWKEAYGVSGSKEIRADFLAWLAHEALASAVVPVEVS